MNNMKFYDKHGVIKIVRIRQRMKHSYHMPVKRKQKIFLFRSVAVQLMNKMGYVRRAR